MKLYFLLFIPLLLFANVIIDDTISYKKINDVKIFIDKENIYSINNIDKMKFVDTNKTAMGYQKFDVYSKLNIKYIGKNEKRVIFINPKATIDNIEVYVFESKKLLTKQILGDQTTTSERELKNRYSIFALTLKPNQEIDIISKIPAGRSVIDVSWIIAEPNIFLNFTIKESIWWGVFIGLIFALIFYNFAMFISLRDKIYLIYSILGLSLLIYQLSRQGILYELFSKYMDLYLIGLLAWIFGALAIVLILIFAILFFETKKNMPKIHKILIFLSIFFTIMTLLLTYTYLDRDFIFELRPIVIPIFILSLLIPPLIGIYAYIKKLNGAIYYLIGHGTYSLSLFYQHLNAAYGNEINLIAIYGASVGVIVEITFLSLALSNRVKLLRVEKEKLNRVLTSKSNISAIGEAIGNISHQWRNSLQKISYINMILMEHLRRDIPMAKDMLTKSTNDIDKSVLFMSETMQSFLDYYKVSKKIEKFNLYISIKEAIKIIDLKIKNSKTDIEIVGDLEVNINGIKNEWMQIWLNLINNSINIATKRDIKNLKITVTIEKDKVTFCDNAKGFDKQTLKSIDKLEYSGLGIKMCKEIAQKYNTKINIINRKDGACISIENLK